MYSGAIAAGPVMRTNRNTCPPTETVFEVTLESGLFLPRLGSDPGGRGARAARPAPAARVAPSSRTCSAGWAAAGLRGRPQLLASAQPAAARSFPRGWFQGSYVRTAACEEPPDRLRGPAVLPSGQRADVARLPQLGRPTGRPPPAEKTRADASRTFVRVECPLPGPVLRPSPPQAARSGEMFICSVAWRAAGLPARSSGSEAPRAGLGRDEMSARAAAAK